MRCGVQQIYAVRRADGLIKIGYSCEIATRLKNLAKSHGPLDVIRVVNGTLRRERAIHNALKAHNEFGEWFRPTAEVLDYISGLAEGRVTPKKDAFGPSSEDQHENAAIKDVAEAATKLFALCYKRSGRSSDKTYALVSKATGITPRVYRRLMNSERTAPTLSAYRRIKAAYLAECEAMLEDLKREFANELDREGSDAVLALRQELQAKKGQAR
jgi:hypothetical protein